MRTSKILGFLFILFLAFGFVSSHLESGEDVRKNGYVIDFGYSPAEIISGNPSNFVFNLINETTEVFVNFTSLWVRISSEDEIIFAGDFFPKDSSVPFVFVFPDSGGYSIETEFYNGQILLVDYEFKIKVRESSRFPFYI